VEVLESFPSHFTHNKERDLHTVYLADCVDPRAILDTLEDRNILLLLIILSLSGEQENLAASGHVELIWRAETSCCLSSCGTHLKNRKILLLLAM
jgi:hypothetical protein